MYIISKSITPHYWCSGICWQITLYKLESIKKISFILVFRGSPHSTSTYLNNMAWLFLSFSFRPKEVTRVGRCGSVSYSVSHLKPLGTIWAEFPTVVEIIMIPGLSECIIITIAHHLSFCRRWCYNWEISCIKSSKIYNHWMMIIIMGIKLIFGYLMVRLNYFCCF